MLKIWFKNPYFKIGIKIEKKIFKENRNQVYEWRDKLSDVEWRARWMARVDAVDASPPDQGSPHVLQIRLSELIRTIHQRSYNGHD